MKFLEAQRLAGQQEKKSIIPGENKMLPGNRIDQQDPISLVSTLRERGQKDAQSEAIAKLAAQLGVDLAEVKGTGRNGDITERDVRKAKKDQDKQTDDKLGLDDK